MKRNFVIASILHIAIIASVVLWENFLGGFGRPAMASVSLYTPADILGDMPKGEGSGRGSYKPSEPAGANTIAGPNAEMSPSDEIRAPQPKADDVLIPKKTQSKKPVKESKPATTKKQTSVATAKKPSTGPAKGPSADDIKNRLMGAVDAAEGGTPYGDNKKAGGGSGKGRIGSPSGSADGVVGGVGQGSANWKYFDHVHDVLYEAWQQPTAAVDKNAMTTVKLRILRDGSIADATIQMGSGNKLMDESVLAAVRTVPRLEPPPDGLLRGEAAIISVNFQVEG